MQKVRNVEILIAFGKRLRDIRKVKNITQEELSYKSGLSLSQIARIETGRLNTSICTVYEIAKALEIEPGELF